MGQSMPAVKLRGMYHFAYPCRDGEETRAFYEDVLGLPLVHFMEVAAVPSTGESGPYAHIFFELGDGSYLAFFDLAKNERPLPSPNTPGWVQHFAIEVASVEEVAAAKARLEAAGVEVLGIVDHEFVNSIYFFDPNGLRLEITTKTDTPGFLKKAADEAHGLLQNWTQAKRAKGL